MHIFCTVSAKRIKCNCIYIADKPEKRFIFEIDGFKICVKTNCGLSIFFYWLIEKCTNGTNIESEKWGKSRICTEIFGHFEVPAYYIVIINLLSNGTEKKRFLLKLNFWFGSILK